jgi:APA family basic amino acid/polyamine antiporter
VPQLAVANLFGAGAADAFSVAVGLTFLATVSAFVVTGSRIYYAMARDGLFPAFAGRVSTKHRIPVLSTIAQSGCAIVLLFAVDFQELYQYASVGLSLFAILFISAVFVLRVRRPDLERPFRVPGYPVVPGLFIVVTLFMAGFAFREWPGPSLWSLGSILAGIPAYLLWTRLRPRPAR